MPEKRTIERAKQAKREGKSPSSQAGEFVREEIHHVREGKHGARSTKQAIAIGLSKARRAGVKLGTPRNAPKRVRDSARRETARAGRKPNPRRSRGALRALKRSGRAAATPRALARQARASARSRGGKARRAAANKAVRTKGARGRRNAAKKAAATRARNASA
jgi:hypothetical protein